jgi:thymidylate synthase
MMKVECQKMYKDSHQDFEFENEEAYSLALSSVLKLGQDTGDRTNTGMRSLFGVTMKFNLEFGFPLITTKKMFTKGVFQELLWFLSGSTSNTELEERGVKFWREWADEQGELPNIYGKQWVRWEDARGNVFNQIEYVINEIKTNPNSRRILFTGWNAAEMQWEDTALPCCHSTVVQFYVREGKYLDMYHYQRSGDMFLGVPVNIASYATLLTMIAQQCDLVPGFMTHTIGVAHIYNNHIQQVSEQLFRLPYSSPSLIIKRKPESIFDYEFEDFEVIDYEHHPAIKGEVAI